MITVRAATPADDATLVRFGRRFYETLPYSDIPYSEASAVRWLALMRERGVLLVAEADGAPVGMAGGIFSSFIFNDEYEVGAELMWWVEPEHRDSGVGSAMLAALENAAYARGAARWSMVAIEDTAERVAKIYARAGYEPAERTYTKVPEWQP